MAKPSNRDKILTEGLKVVHARGFGGASVRDIIEAAGVPQGSFTNHFASKEAFGVEILDIYFARTSAVLDATLRNDSLAPLARLHAFVDANARRMESEGMEHGCLFGNFVGEAVAHSELLRVRVAAVFGAVCATLAACLDAAVRAGELAPCDTAALAEVILGSLQGALMLAKVQRDARPLQRFEQVLFGTLLARPVVRVQQAA